MKRTIPKHASVSSFKDVIHSLRAVKDRVKQDGIAALSEERSKFSNFSVTSLFSQQVTQLNNWYTKILRLDEVKRCQDKVNLLQDQLFEAQNNRREISVELSDLRRESNSLHSQINEARRTENDDRYIELVKLERDIKRKETNIGVNLQNVDKLERDLFTAFTNAIRDSHETQRSQAEYTKYFGIILSITGSFLSFLYITFRKEDLKHFIDERFLEINNSLDTKQIAGMANHTEFSQFESLLNNKLQSFESSIVGKSLQLNEKHLLDISSLIDNGSKNTMKAISTVLIKGDDTKAFNSELAAGKVDGLDKFTIVKYSGLAIVLLFLISSFKT